MKIPDLEAKNLTWVRKTLAKDFNTLVLICWPDRSSVISIMCFRMEDPNRLLTVFSLSKHQWYRKKRNINTSETYCCHTSNGSIIICRYNQYQKKNCSFFPELTDCYLRNSQVAYQMQLFTVFWIPFLSQLEPILMSLLSMSTFLEKKRRFRKLHLQYYKFTLTKMATIIMYDVTIKITRYENYPS